MNAQCYRVIFNKARGMLMVVSEAARSQGKTSNPADGGSSISQIAGGSQTTTHTNGYYQGGQLNSLRSHLLLALGMATIISTSLSTNAHADSTKIVADRNAAAAQQAAILKASNGKTQVNIQTPSAAGVSRNVFSQFDVGSDGAILNNSRTNAQTQIAGWVEGNPYLARGEARVILNEVNSSDPSRLGGYTEIAGGKAELIIANPAGISCAGCGFINASRTTLTTGQARMEQGKLTGFDVTGGKVRIDGDGLDTSSSDYTQIIAKTTDINAGIYAKNLDVITGNNKVSYEADAKDTVITSNSATNSTNQATGVALDVSALGAMYAGKIRLIGTEKGMGVTNAGSIIASNVGGLQLDYNGNLVNSGSLIANKDKVAVNTRGNTINNSGTIASSQDTTTLVSSSLDNSGVISSYDKASLQQTGAITNSGEIAAGSFEVSASGLNNTGKLLQTGSGQLGITTSSLINREGGIIGQDLYADASTPPATAPTTNPPTTANNGSTVQENNGTTNPSEPTLVILPPVTRDGSITVDSLTNSGSIYSNNKINIAADSVTNQDKSSLALGRLDIANSGSLINTDSRVQLENIDWQLARFDNSDSQITATNTINIRSADQINNTSGTIDAVGNIALSAQNTLNNTSGAIRSNGTIMTQSAVLDNTQGVISSQGSLSIDNRGNLINNQGRLQSDDSLTVNTKGYSNTEGTIIGVQRAAINTLDDLTINSNNNNIQAGNLALITQGIFTNTSKLAAQNVLTITANRIDNRLGSELTSSGTTQLNAATDINNRGLINGVNTYLNATDSVNNYSGGRIYGDQVAITANTLNNTPDSSDPAPVIAARNRLDIGVTTLNNNPNQARSGKFNEDFNGQARLISNGALYIGGSLDANQQAVGRATTVTNKGASIESVGDMSISTDTLNNVNADFRKETVLASSDRVIEYSPANQTTRYDKDDIEIYVHGWDGDWEKTLRTADGNYNDYEKFEYDAKLYEDKTLSSDASLIRAGGNLSINSNNAINDHSLVVDGLTLTLKDDPTQTSRFGFQNISTEGNTVLKNVNSIYYSYRTKDKTRPDNPFSDRPYTYQNGPYNVADESKVINAYQLSILKQDIDKVVVAHNVTDTDGTAVTTIPTDEIRSSSTAPSLPNNGLFGINPHSSADYLIETDPAFANYKDWLSSSYMLDRFQLDPNITQKRLGDGYYEQQYIRDQIMMLTGRYYLGDYRSLDEQYKGLMDAGITTAQTLNLRPGIALTDDQVAQLTTDMVWLVQQQVALADGSSQQVLVPKVYTRQAVGKIDGTGSLIAADSIDMQLSGDLTNQGSIVGHQSVNINAVNLTNANGGLIKGDYVQIGTANDLNNLSGTLQANKAMQLDVGGDLNNKSLTYTTSSAKDASSSTRTDIRQIASIYVGDSLKGQVDAKGNPLTTFVANVAGDTTFAAGRLNNQGGSSRLDTKGDVKLDAVNVGYQSNSIGDANNYFKQGESTDIGSQITSNNDILLTGNNISGTAAQISSTTGNVGILADGNVNFIEGRSTNNLSTASKSKENNWYGSKRISQSVDFYEDNAYITNISGNSVFIDSKNGNVSLIGSNAKASEEARVAAMNGKVTVQSAVDKESLSSNKSTSNFYKETGQQKGYERETLNETGISGSSVYVNGKNVDINAASLQAKNGNLQVGDASLATDVQGNLQLDDNGKPIIKSGSIDNLTFGTIELEDSEWNNKQKSYKGIAKIGMQVAGVIGGTLGITDGITISKSSEDTSSNTSEAASNLEGNNILVGGKTVQANGTTFTTTQVGGSTFVLGDDIDFGVATTTSTNTQRRQEETIGGEGIKLNSDSLQLGAVVRTDSEDTKTTTTATHQGVKIDSDYITVLGDMTDGSLTTTAAKFNANEETGSLLVGAKTTNLGGIENTETVTNNNKTDTTRISVDVHHASVDVISAAEQVKEAGSAVAAAKNELSDAKDRVSRGELSADAVKDYEINLAAATLNLANAQINLGSTAAAATKTYVTGGFSATANAEHTQTTSTDTQTQGEWQGTELNGANATLVGDNFTGVGLKGNIGKLYIDNLGSFTLNAGTNTSSGSSTSKTNSQTGSISTTGSASLGISQQKSSAQSQGNTYTNSEINVGEFNGYADTTNLTGGRINAGGGSYATDTLNIETVQDSASSSNKSSGGNLGINFSGGVPSGGSIGANKANGSSQSLIATEQSGIVYSSDDHNLMANNTSNIGGIIAKIQTDNDGNQTNGTLNFTTGSLTTKDLINTETEEQRSIGGSLSVGSTPTGKSLNNVGIQLGNTGRDFESETRATIGQGAIVTGDALTGKDSLAGVNRDALNTETITKDVQTGGLAVDTGIDTRVLTNAGRAEIIDEQRDLLKNLKATAAITGTAGLAVPAITAGLFDKGNGNPDSQNKSGIDKAKDNFKQLTNNLETGMSDNTVNLNATLEAIVEGELTNTVDNKDTLNQFNTAITTGTDAEGTQISLVDDLRNVNGDHVLGTTNVMNGTDTYLNTDSMDKVVELINHEAAHQNGQGETAAHVMGETGNSAYNLGTWANSGAIAEERTTITPKPITTTNDAKAQQEQLASDKEKLKAQQDSGDTFEDDNYSQRNGRWGSSADHTLYSRADSIYKNDKPKADLYISGYRAGEGDAFLKPVKDALSSVAHPVDTVIGMWDVITSPKVTYKAVKVSVKDWYRIYNEAKVSDPRLYGIMRAQLDANIGFEAASVVVSGGTMNAIKASRVASKLKAVEQKKIDAQKVSNNASADYNANNSNSNSENINSKNKPDSQNKNVNQNFNYQDYINDNAPDLSQYDADIPNALDQFDIEQAAKSEAFEADLKVQRDKFNASMAEINASIDELSKSIEQGNVKLTNDSRGEANGTKSAINDENIDAQKPFTSNGTIYYPVDGGGYSSTKPLNTADKPVVDSSNDTIANNQEIDRVYRGEDRTEDTIFNEGFQAKAPDANVSLEEYVNSTPSPDSQYISTSTDKNTSINFATKWGQREGYLYDMDVPENGIDIEKTLGDKADFDEKEIAAIGEICKTTVRGCQPYNKNGTTKGPYIENPNYRKN